MGALGAADAAPDRLTGQNVRLLSSIPLLRIVPDDTKFDFMRFRRISFPVSALLSIVAIFLFFHPGLNLGIDFRGGTLMEIQAKSGTADLAQDAHDADRRSVSATSSCSRSAGRPTC